jgi:lipoic acid synthetase
MRVIRRKPDWLKVRLPNTPEFNHVKKILMDLRLHSVCQEARCPNIAECFHSGTATFLILGEVCTRNCRYCNVRKGIPESPDKTEPQRIIAAVKALGLHYVVVTSVTRDDLPDGGAGIFAGIIEDLHREVPGCRVEVLIPDFRGNRSAVDIVLNAQPDVINHNMEVTRALFPELRPRGDYDVSLNLLRHVAGENHGPVSKSGFMVGFGEGWDDILDLINDLAQAGCQRLTIGQYQQPNRDLWPVVKYYDPDEFAALKHQAYKMGFEHVEAGPLVRSSYHAANALSGKEE